MESVGIDWIDIRRDRKGFSPHLHDEQHHGSGAAARLAAKFCQMLGPTVRHRIGKFRQTLAAQEMAILHLDIAGRSSRIREEKVDTAVCAIRDLAAERRIAGKFGNPTGKDRLLGQPVGIGRVDADKLRAVGQISLDQLPGIRQFCLGIGGWREEDAGSGLLQAEHRAGIGAMRRYNAAIRQCYIRQEALVALDEASFDKGRAKPHG